MFKLRFSIGSLLILTAVVALLMTVWKINSGLFWFVVIMGIMANLMGIAMGLFVTHVIRLPNDGSLHRDEDDGTSDAEDDQP